METFAFAMDCFTLLINTKVKNYIPLTRWLLMMGTTKQKRLIALSIVIYLDFHIYKALKNFRESNASVNQNRMLFQLVNMTAIAIMKAVVPNLSLFKNQLTRNVCKNKSTINLSDIPLQIMNP